MTKKKRKAKEKAYKLNWEYCECGCHQHTVTICGRHYSMYNDLKGTYYLGINTHYACSANAPKFKSFTAADAAAYKDVVPHLRKVPGLVSNERLAKLVRRLQRRRYTANKLLKTYHKKKDWVGYEGAKHEGLACLYAEEEIKKLMAEGESNG